MRGFSDTEALATTISICVIAFIMVVGFFRGVRG